MHQVKAFQESDEPTVRLLASQYPLATLIVPTKAELLVNHVPLLWEGDFLNGHIARANELVAVLGQQPQPATAVFHGPDGYISPADYPSKAATGKVVPTWNYAVLHLHGELQLNTDPGFIRAQVERLTAQQENTANPDAPWQLDDAPADFQQALLQGIVGIQLSITRWSAKYKLSQNRASNDRQGARNGAAERGNRTLADLMAQTETPNGET